ncbi:MAG: lytic transglycosylase domain-containing protein [Archangium sp.]|nr:lytic transglycosylase domain-containing protein [Archangium sp.]
MKWLLPLVVVASAATIAWTLKPLAEPPAATRVQVEGVRTVRHPDFERIEATLLERAPGWGIELRNHVAEAIAEESERAGLDPMLVLAVIDVESEFRQHATSVVGARGLMQLRPTTLVWVAQREGVKLSRAELEADPSLNVRLGVRYLKYLKELFRGRLDLTLMAYNCGPNKLAGALKARNTEPWHNYVRAVRREYAVLKKAHGESGDWTMASR